MRSCTPMSETSLLLNTPARWVIWMKKGFIEYFFRFNLAEPCLPICLETCGFSFLIRVSICIQRNDCIPNQVGPAVEQHWRHPQALPWQAQPQRHRGDAQPRLEPEEDV